MISVVIPLYNKARHIKRALDSVLSQTYQDFEVIVVNDGSTDESERVVEQYAVPRIRLVNQRNAGASAARNRGIVEARHDLIAFLDADDEWLPEHLGTISRLSLSHPDCGIYATGRIVHKRGGYEVKSKYPGVPGTPWEGVIPSYFLTAQGVSPACCSTAAVWKTVFKATGVFPVDERYGEDIEVWCRIALRYRVAFSTYYGAVTHSDADNRAGARIDRPIYAAAIGTLDNALGDGSLPDWASHKSVLDYRNTVVLVAARSGLVNLGGYGAAARRMLRSTWATRKLRGTAVLWYSLSFLPKSVVSSLWRVLVASVRFIKRTFDLPR